MVDPITDPEILQGYLTDASNLPGHADALVRPRTTAEVAEVVAHCQAASLPLTVTAGRTSTTGSAVPRGGWLLSTERMDALIAASTDTATAQGGILLGALQDQLAAMGRQYPPDPTSRHDCTLGASIATNASGARSFRYGPTRPWVAGLEVVLPTGEIVQVTRDTPIPADWPVLQWTEPAVKTAAGYAPPRSLLDLFIGQEGTLGVITQATVRLTDLPADVLGLLVFFGGRTTAVDAMRTLRRHARADPAGAVSPLCIEYLDHHCLALAEERVRGVPGGARAALFCEQAVGPSGADEHLAAWLAVLKESGAIVDETWVADDHAGRARLQALRHAIPAGVNERVLANGMPKIGTDLAVPDAGLDEMIALYEAAPMEHVLFGHLGDNHLHLNLLPRTEAELVTARAYYDQLAKRAIALGGTVSAEHGIGKLKRAQLSWMVGQPVLSQFAALKRHVDPAGVLGRGNILAL